MGHYVIGVVHRCIFIWQVCSVALYKCKLDETLHLHKTLTSSLSFCIYKVNSCKPKKCQANFSSFPRTAATNLSISRAVFIFSFQVDVSNLDSITTTTKKEGKTQKTQQTGKSLSNFEETMDVLKMFLFFCTRLDNRNLCQIFCLVCTQMYLIL